MGIRPTILLVFAFVGLLLYNLYVSYRWINNFSDDANGRFPHELAAAVLLSNPKKQFQQNPQEQQHQLYQQQQHRITKVSLDPKKTSDSQHHVIKSMMANEDDNSAGLETFWKQHMPWKPLDCASYLRQAASNLSDPNEGCLYARYITSVDGGGPPFWMAVHNQSVDKVRWDVLMQHGKYYETTLTQAFVDILSDAPAHARVVDVGGNVGWFTLLSAALGHHVDVFEPLPMNVIRLCQSTYQLNPDLNWKTLTTESEINHRHKKQRNNNDASSFWGGGSIHIRPMGVSKQTSLDGGGSITFQQGNPGSGTFSDFVWKKYKNHHIVSSIPLVALDDLARDLDWFSSSSNVTIAILKIDIEGGEMDAIQGARQLLQSNAHGRIQNLFVEATKAAGRKGNNKEHLRTMLLYLAQLPHFTLYRWGGFRGPGKALPQDFPTASPSAHATYIMNHFLNNQDQVNLWYKATTKLW